MTTLTRQSPTVTGPLGHALRQAEIDRHLAEFDPRLDPRQVLPATGPPGSRTAAGHGPAPARAVRALEELERLRAPELAGCLRLALASDHPALHAAALRLVPHQPAPGTWCPAVYALFDRLDPGHAGCPSSTWLAAARFLLGYRYPAADVRKALAVRAPDDARADVGWLLYEHDDPAALGVLAAGVRSDSALARDTCAALLGAVAGMTDQGAAELAAFLAECDDPERTRSARLALPRPWSDPSGATGEDDAECESGQYVHSMTAHYSEKIHDLLRGE